MNWNEYAEVISAVEFRTSDGATIMVDTSEGGIGIIEIKPWQSLHEDGGMFVTAEDSAVFNPVSGHDVLVLKFLYEHAAAIHAKAMAEEQQRQDASKNSFQAFGLLP